VNPSVEDRLNSVVRAIGGVILPALPESASLAREQAMLAMGHIQIILGQLPATAQFEADEAKDIHRLGTAVAELTTGGVRARSTADALSAMLSHATFAESSSRTRRVQDAINAVLLALVEDGDPDATNAVHATILEHGAARALKDRQWFAAMGFDSDFCTR